MSFLQKFSYKEREKRLLRFRELVQNIIKEHEQGETFYNLAHKYKLSYTAVFHIYHANKNDKDLVGI